MNLIIKKVCKEKGWTVAKLADAMGVEAVTMSRTINGNPKLKTLQRIAAVLEVHITDLFEQPADKCPTCKQYIIK